MKDIEQDLSQFVKRSSTTISSKEPAKVRVHVTHGDLWFAENPVLLGHYDGDGIVSAEAYVDICLEGQLSDRNQLGIYPGEIGASQFFRPKISKKFKGALIIGLGEFGKLSPGKLVKSVTMAIKSLSLNSHTVSRNGSNGISCLMVGTQYGSFSLRQSIQAILIGIQQANEVLSGKGEKGIHPIEAVEFIEIYEDKAIRAVHTLKSILEEEWQGAVFSLSSECLKRAPGRRKRALNVLENDWWQRLKIQKTNDGQVRFTFLTDRARAEITDVRTQDKIVNSLILRSSKHSRWDQRIARLMFELLIPNELKEIGGERKNTILLLDKETAQMPWELIQDTTGGDHDPVAVRAGFVRQLETSSFRKNVSHSPNNTVLIVGDPKSELPELLSARAEADEVASVFESSEDDYHVECSIQESSLDLLKRVFERPYQIMHFAGHGILDRTDSAIPSGLAIGDGMSLSAAELAQLRIVPELVFVNCCHLGSLRKRTDEMLQTNEFAANVGISLIEMGVKAVVVAGWAVEDAAASEFASVFYRAMLVGESFGDAVLKARRSIYESFPDSNTWGAYQVYGDPFYMLRSQTQQQVRGRQSYVDPVEPIIDLHNIRISSKDGSASRRSTMTERLKKVIDQVQEVNGDWLKDAKFIENVAFAYLGLGDYERAIEYFDKLAESENAEFSVSLVEKMANAKIRHGISLFLKGQKGGKERGRELITQATKKLELLLQMGKTSERFSLLGGAYKRFAFLEATKEGRLSCLSHASSNYLEAFKLKIKLDQNPVYPHLNYLGLEAIKSLLTGHPGISKSDMRSMKSTLKKVEEEYRREPSFWNAISATDAKLVQLLCSVDERDPLVAEISDGYVQARKDIGSPSKWGSVIDHVRFYKLLLSPVRGEGGSRIQKSKWKALDNIERSLKLHPLSSEEAIKALKYEFEHVVSILGYSALGYEEPALVKEHFVSVLEGLDPSEVIINAGATSKGIGLVYPIAKKMGFRTIGVVSSKSLEENGGFSKFVDKIFVIEDSIWGGLNEDDSISETTEVILSISKMIYAFGGHQISYQELGLARERGIPVTYFAAEMDHKEASRKGISPEARNGRAAELFA